MDARWSPGWIFRDHAENQFSHFLRSLWSPDSLSDSGNQLPIQAEAGPVPPNDCFWSHNDEALFPSGPEPSCQNPELLVAYEESWPGTFSF